MVEPHRGEWRVIIGVSSNCDIPFVQGQVRAYDQQTGTSLGCTSSSPTDSSALVIGMTPQSTGTVTSTCQPARPPTPGRRTPEHLARIRAVQHREARRRDGHLLWKAPAPTHTGDPDYASSPSSSRATALPWWARPTRTDGSVRTVRTTGNWCGEHWWGRPNPTGSRPRSLEVSGTALVCSSRQYDEDRGSLDRITRPCVEAGRRRRSTGFGASLRIRERRVALRGRLAVRAGDAVEQPRPLQHERASPARL